VLAQRRAAAGHPDVEDAALVSTPAA